MPHEEVKTPVVAETCPLGYVALERVRAPYLDNLLMAVAWHDALMWAAVDEQIALLFEQDTGLKWPYKSIFGRGPRELSEEEIDHLVNQFALWFNKTIWGESPFGEPHATPESQPMSSL